MQKKDFIPYLIRYTEINKKWIKYLNINLKIITFLGENKGQSLCNLESDKYFLGMAPKTQSTKKIPQKDKLDSIKIKDSLKDS